MGMPLTWARICTATRPLEMPGNDPWTDSKVVCRIAEFAASGFCRRGTGNEGLPGNSAGCGGGCAAARVGLTDSQPAKQMSVKAADQNRLTPIPHPPGERDRGKLSFPRRRAAWESERGADYSNQCVGRKRSLRA